jgi:hypothetical protein
MTARGLGLLHAGRGDHATAAAWLAEATQRSNRVPDRYQWVHGHVLDAAVAEHLRRGETEQARPLLAALHTLAARCELGELLVRAQLHRHDLGEPGALASARLLAAGIDNPALDSALDSALG